MSKQFPMAPNKKGVAVFSTQFFLLLARKHPLHVIQKIRPVSGKRREDPLPTSPEFYVWN